MGTVFMVARDVESVSCPSSQPVEAAGGCHSRGWGAVWINVASRMFSCAIVFAMLSDVMPLNLQSAGTYIGSPTSTWADAEGRI